MFVTMPALEEQTQAGTLGWQMTGRSRLALGVKSLRRAPSLRRM
jgi:hypothetical protein